MLKNLAIVLLCLAPPVAAQDEEMREAARLDAEGKCAEAEPLYARALAKGPPSPALLNNAGNHYLVCGQPEKARELFERLVKLNTSHPNANLQLARLAADRKEGAKALQHLAHVKDAGPAVLLLRAEALHYAGKKAEAEAILNGLEKDAAADPRALFTVGVACARMGLYDRAERAFNAVAAQLPDNYEVLYNLGRAAARARHYDRARSALEVAVKLKPDDVDSILELGLVHAAREDYARAVFVLAQARQKAPQRPDVLLALARAAEEAGYYGDSALAYDEYLKLRPADDRVRRDRARVCGHTDTRVEEGLKELAWYIEKYPKDPVGHFYLGQLTWRTEPEKSLEQLATAVRLNPDFASARLSYGWLLHRMGRTAEAVPHLESAVKLAPESFRALDQLGVVYIALDRPADAEKVLRKAFELGPDEPGVLLHLGQALMATGRDEEAQKHLDRFRQLRPQIVRDPRREPGMIESATLSPAERAGREIERFRAMAAAHAGDAEFQMHLAGLLLREGRTTEAEAEYRKLLSMNAQPKVWEESGRFLLRAEQYELAREFLEKAVEQRPSARLDLAIALFSIQGPDQALKALDQVPEGERTGDYLLTKARILDASGRAEEAQRVLREGLRQTGTRPEVARDAALLLVRHRRNPEALELIDRALKASSDNPDLRLVRAVLLGLLERGAEAETALREIQSRWPEWDRPYLVHGLLIEAARPPEARRKFQTALTLGSKDLASECALARLNGSSPPDVARCVCVKGLHEVLVPSCEKIP
ncbi:MAG: tetratricopeptide repeat protein [Bryobacteraceae bacterium]|nr:tetratricopeptide repeat protein [Bryobacteraceae bacterium]